MKNSYLFIITLKVRIALLALLCSITAPLCAQEEATEAIEDDGGNKPVRAHFESSWVIDHQTVTIPSKGTLEFMIQHRFGTLQNGVKDLWGLYSPSNIRLGMAYTLVDNFGFGYLRGPLALGIGTTKNQRIQDVNVKYGMLRQTRNGRIPVSVTYYGNVAIETQKKTEALPNGRSSDRFSFFNQIIISRRFSENLSVQIAPSVSHYNVVEPGLENDHFAAALTIRYKFSPQSAVILNVDQPITAHQYYNPQPNFGIGLEVATGSHAFQIFVSSFSSIIPQRNNVFNQNAGLRFYDDDPFVDWRWRGFQIGFNITRLWNF